MRKATVTIRHGYELSAAIAAVCRAFGVSPVVSDYGSEDRQVVLVPAVRVSEFANRLRDATAARAVLEIAIDEGLG